MDALWRLDREVFRAIHEGLRREWLDPLAVLVTNMGLGEVQFGALLLVWLRERVGRWLPAVALVMAAAIGVFSGPVQALAWALLVGLFWGLPSALAGWALVAAVATGAVRIAFARSIERMRPSNFDFAQPLEPIYGMTSFPSGHASTSLAIAVVVALALRGDDRAWLAWLIAGWACLVGFTRVYAGVHYPLDVIGAGLLAVCVGIIIDSWRRRRLTMTGSVAGR
jgi:membrane-associated phospholipid phosphatase